MTEAKCAFPTMQVKMTSLLNMTFVYTSKEKYILIRNPLRITLQELEKTGHPMLVSFDLNICGFNPV